MVLNLSKERKTDLVAIVIFGLWVIAWVNNAWFEGPDIPGALNIIMPAAVGILLGVNLPIELKKKEGNGKTQ